METKQLLILAVFLTLIGFMTTGTISFIFCAVGGFIFGWNVMEIVKQRNKS